MPEKTSPLAVTDTPPVQECPYPLHLLDEAAVRRKAGRLTDYNDSATEARNFKLTELRDILLNEEDLAGMEANYSSFVNTVFTNCDLSRMEGHFARFENVVFKYCTIESADLAYASFENVRFENCTLSGTDFPFARGEITFHECCMPRCSAHNARMKLNFNASYARNFEGSCAALELHAINGSLQRCELHDCTLTGEITGTDLTRAELCRSELSGLKITDCAIHDLDTEDDKGFDIPEEELEDLEEFFSDNE